MDAYEGIIEALRTSHRINMLLLDAITDEGLACTLSTRGGRDVAAQLAHVHNNRIYQLERRGKGLEAGLSKFPTKTSPSREELRSAHEASVEAMVTYIEGVRDGTHRTFRKGPVVYLAYHVAHEAHHRGNILLTLKQCGHAVDKDVRYAVWDWDRR